MKPQVIVNPFGSNSVLNATSWLILNACALKNNQPHLIVWINLFGGNSNLFKVS